MNHCIGLHSYTIINLMIMPSTIYINGRFLTQKLSGVQRYAFEISKQLSLFDNYDFILLLPSKSSIREEYGFLFNIQKIGSNTGHLWEQIDLPQYLKNKNTTLLINLTNSAPILYKNKFSTIHDLSVFENNEWFSFKYRTFYRFLIPRILKTSKKILTDSHFSKEEIIKKYNIDIENVNVIYCASSISKINNINKEKSEDYLLFVGGLSKRKNLKNLINAFIELSNKNIKLKVVGSDINHLVSDDINQYSNIEYIDGVSDNQLTKLYSNARMLVFPSFYEGFGLPPLEAMSCGCPVIISDIPVLRELYENSALYVNPYSVKDIKNTISNLLNDNNLSNSLVEQGLEQSEKYSWKKSADQIIHLIEDGSK